MARYFAGNTLAAFSRSSIGVVEVTTAGTFDSTYVSNSILVGTGSAYIESAPFSATGVVWTHFELYSSHVDTSGAPGPSWWNGAIGIFRLFRNDPLGNYSFTPQYWNGSAWTSNGNTFSMGGPGLHQFDVKIDMTTGAFEVYILQELVSSGSGWTGHQTTMTNWRGYPESGNNVGTRYSQVMISDYDMRLSKYMTRPITGNGTYTDGVGSYTDIDETVVSDTDSVYVSGIGDQKGFVFTDLTLPVGFVIGGMVVNARGRVAGGVVTEGHLGVLNAGDVELSADLGYDVVYTPSCFICELDPDTAAAFTQSGFNTAEVYLEAA